MSHKKTRSTLAYRVERVFAWNGLGLSLRLQANDLSAA